MQNIRSFLNPFRPKLCLMQNNWSLQFGMHMIMIVKKMKKKIMLPFSIKIIITNSFITILLTLFACLLLTILFQRVRIIPNSKGPNVRCKTALPLHDERGGYSRELRQHSKWFFCFFVQMRPHFHKSMKLPAHVEPMQSTT